jgi:hypothetical protein
VEAPQGPGTPAGDEQDARLRNQVVDWNYWRGRMTDSSRCDVGRRAGVWALDVLEAQMGTDWLERILENKRQLPPEVVAAPHYAVAYAALLRLAAHLKLGVAVPGFARLRKALTRDLRDELQLHVSLQLEVAHLALANDADVELEVTGRRHGAPLDVRVSFDDATLSVETFVVLNDDQMRAGRDLADEVSNMLHQITFRHDIHLVGEITEGLTNEVVPGLIEAIEAASVSAASKQLEQAVLHPVADLIAVPRALAQTGTGYSLPAGTGKGWDRTRSKLQTKARQALSSGATWLRVDLLDSTWQLTPWAQKPLGEKTHEMATAIRETLHRMDGIRGVVVSSGAATAMSQRTGESTRQPGGVFGLRRDLGSFFVRETIIVPLANAEEEAFFWVCLYDTEPRWLDGVLKHFGFPPLDAVAAFLP